MKSIKLMPVLVIGLLLTDHTNYVVQSVGLQKNKIHHKHHNLKQLEDKNTEGKELYPKQYTLKDTDKNVFDIFNWEGDLDIVNSEPAEVTADLHRIKMVVLQQGSSIINKCEPGRVASVHWTAKLAQPPSALVEDTLKKFGENNPEQIRIGARETVRCLDLTLAQMRPGDIFRVTCPEQLAYGDKLTYGFFDDVVIPPKSDLKFTIKMLKCTDFAADVKVKSSKKLPPSTDSKPIISEEEEKQADSEEDVPTSFQKPTKPKTEVIKEAEAEPLKKKLKEDVKKLVQEEEQVDKLKKKLVEQEVEIKQTEKEIRTEKLVVSKEQGGDEESVKDEDQEFSIKQKEKTVAVKKTSLAEAKKDVAKLDTLVKKAEENVVKEEKVIVAAKDVKPEETVSESLAKPTKVTEKEQETKPGEDIPGESVTEEVKKEAKEEKQELKTDEAQAVIVQTPTPADPKIKESADKNKKVAEEKIEKQKEEKKEEIKNTEKTVSKDEKEASALAVEKEKIIEETKDAEEDEDVKEKKREVEKKVEAQINKVESQAKDTLSQVEKQIKKVEKEVEKIQPLKHGECFFVIPLLENGKQSDIVMTIDPKDKYAPRRTGVHDVRMRKRLTDAAGIKTQQWHYNSKTQALHSELFPRRTLFEGTNKNLIVFPYIGRVNQKFQYDDVNQTWKNISSQNSMQLSEPKFVDNANLITGKFTNEAGQKFGFEYCNENHDDDSHE